jgi:L-rhamnose mutarotase
MKTYCFALDLHDAPDLIAEYKWYHRKENVWPEVLDSIQGSAIVSERIYLTGNRLVLILETGDDFSLDAYSAASSSNPTMQAWEKLMWRYQKPLPGAQPGEKWVLMENIFEVK